jgi:ubiquitin-protein ligase
MNSLTEAGGGRSPGRVDQVRQSFLIRQREEGMALAAGSDLLDLQPIGGAAPEKYIAAFQCRGLVRHGDGSIRGADRFGIGIVFPPDYHQRADTFEVLTLLHPRNVWHPNIHAQTPHICIGWLSPGTSLVDILYQCFELLTFNRFQTADALNPDASAWVRSHPELFPIDRRPLKRSRPAPEVAAGAHRTPVGRSKSKRRRART